MKKVISIIMMIVGVFVAAGAVIPMIVGAIIKTQIPASVGIIGGADGPTAVMVVGELGTWHVVGEILVGILLLVAGIILFRKCRKR